MGRGDLDWLAGIRNILHGVLEISAINMPTQVAQLSLTRNLRAFDTKSSLSCTHYYTIAIDVHVPGKGSDLAGRYWLELCDWCENRSGLNCGGYEIGGFDKKADCKFAGGIGPKH